MSDNRESEIHREVQRYYGETLASTEDLKTTACCTATAPSDLMRDILGDIHPEVTERYYGCGLILPEALEGLRVLDLGCGAGRDVYLLSRLVGEAGKVVGVDMTPEQLAVAERHREWHAQAYGYADTNVSFIEGNIEKLDETSLEDQSFDLIVSNCVLNLTVDKAAVLRSAHRLLSPGGEMYFSDVYADRRIPSELASNPVLYGECLSGALYWDDFLRLAAECGFKDPRLVADDEVAVTDAEISKLTGAIRFRSATCRLFRAPGLEPGQEDYGQLATYLGSIPEHPERLELDSENSFPKGSPVPISANTARIISISRFADHFQLDGEKSTHFGAFKGNLSPDLFATADEAVPVAACC